MDQDLDLLKMPVSSTNPQANMKSLDLNALPVTNEKPDQKNPVSSSRSMQDPDFRASDLFAPQKPKPLTPVEKAEKELEDLKKQKKEQEETPYIPSSTSIPTQSVVKDPDLDFKIQKKNQQIQTLLDPNWTKKFDRAHKDIDNYLAKDGDPDLKREALFFNEEQQQSLKNITGQVHGLNEWGKDNAMQSYYDKNFLATEANLAKKKIIQDHGIVQFDTYVTQAYDGLRNTMLSDPEKIIYDNNKKIKILSEHPEKNFRAINDLKAANIAAGGVELTENKGRRPIADPKQYPTEAIYDQSVNAKMDEFQAMPNFKDRLNGILETRYLAYNRVKDIYNQVMGLAEPGKIATKDLPMVKGKDAEGKPIWDRPLIYNTNPNIDPQNPDVRTMLQAEMIRSKVELEAAFRLSKLNQDPTVLKADWGTRWENFGKSLLETSKTTTSELRQPTQNILNEAGYDMNDEQRKALEGDFWEDFMSATGGAINIGTKFAIASYGMGRLGAAEFIQSLKSATPAYKGIRALSSAYMKRASGWLLDAAYNEAVFQNMGGKPGEGVIFMGASGAINKVGKEILSATIKSGEGKTISQVLGRARSAKTPLNEKINNIAALEQISFSGSKTEGKAIWANTKAFAPEIAKESIKSSVALTIANNAISLAEGLNKALSTDQDFQYQLDKIYGVDENGNNKWKKAIVTSLISNLAFGPINFPEHLIGIRKQYIDIANKQLPILKKLKIDADYNNMPYESALIDNFIKQKVDNIKVVRDKMKVVDAYTKMMGEYQKSMGQMSKEDIMQMNTENSLRDRAIFQKRFESIPRGQNEIENNIIDEIENFSKTTRDKTGLLKQISDNPMLLFQQKMNNEDAVIQELNDELKTRIGDGKTPRAPDQVQGDDVIREKIDKANEKARKYREMYDYIRDNKGGNQQGRNFIKEYADAAGNVMKEGLSPEEVDFVIERRKKIISENEIYQPGEELMIKNGPHDVERFENGTPQTYRITADNGTETVRAKAIDPISGEEKGLETLVHRSKLTRLDLKEEKEKTTTLAEEHRNQLGTILKDPRLTEEERRNYTAQLYKLNNDPLKYTQDTRDWLQLQIEKVKNDSELSDKQRKERLDDLEYQIQLLGEEDGKEKVKPENKKKKDFTPEEKNIAKTNEHDVAKLNEDVPKSEIFKDKLEENRDALNRVKDEILTADEPDPAQIKAAKEIEKNIEALKGKPIPASGEQKSEDKGLIKKAEEREANQKALDAEKKANETAQKIQDHEEEITDLMTTLKESMVESGEGSNNLKFNLSDIGLQVEVVRGNKSNDFKAYFTMKSDDTKINNKSVNSMSWMARSNDTKDILRDVALAIKDVVGSPRSEKKEEPAPIQKATPVKTEKELWDEMASLNNIKVVNTEAQQLKLELDEEQPTSHVSHDPNIQQGRSLLVTDNETLENAKDINKFVPYSINKAFNRIWNALTKDKIFRASIPNVYEYLIDQFRSGKEVIHREIIPYEYKKALNRLKLEGKKTLEQEGITINELPELIKSGFLEALEKYIQDPDFVRQNAATDYIYQALKEKDFLVPLETIIKESDKETQDRLIDAINLSEVIRDINDSEQVYRVFDRIFNRVYKALEGSGVNEPKKVLYQYFRDNPIFEEKIKQGKEAWDEWIKDQEGEVPNALSNSNLTDHGYSDIVSLLSYIKSLNEVHYLNYKVLNDEQGLNVQNANQNTVRYLEFEQKLRDHIHNIGEYVNNFGKGLNKVVYNPPTTLEEQRSNSNTIFSGNQFKADIGNFLIQAREAKTKQEADFLYGTYLEVLTGIDRNLWKQYFVKNNEKDYCASFKNNVPKIVNTIEHLYDNNSEQGFNKGYPESIYRYFTNVDIESTDKTPRPDNNIVKLLNVLQDIDSKSWQIIDPKTKRTIPALQQESYFTRTLKSITTASRFKTDRFKFNPFVQHWMEQRTNPKLVMINKIFMAASDGKKSREKTYKDISRDDLTRIFLHNFFDSENPNTYLSRYKQFANKDQHYLMETPRIRDAKEYYDYLINSMPEEITKTGYFPTHAELEQEVDKLFEFLNSDPHYGNLKSIIRGVDPTIKEMQPDLADIVPASQFVSEQEASRLTKIKQLERKNQIISTWEQKLNFLKERLGLSDIIIMNAKELKAAPTHNHPIILKLVNPKEFTKDLSGYHEKIKYKEQVDQNVADILSKNFKIEEYTGKGPEEGEVSLSDINKIKHTPEEINERATQRIKNRTEVVREQIKAREFIAGQPRPEGSKDIKLEDKLMKDGLREFVYNEAISEINLDQVFIGDPRKWVPEGKTMDEYINSIHDGIGLNRFRDDIVKRLGSFNSSGTGIITGMKNGVGETENHLILKDLPFNKGDQNQYHTKKYTDGMEYYTSEHGKRLQVSAGTVTSKQDKYPELESVKPIYVHVDENGAVTIMKGSAMELEHISDMNSLEGSIAKQLTDFIRQYNAGKEYVDQIHSVSFSPSTTKLTDKQPLDLFETQPDGTWKIKNVSESDLNKAIDQRDTKNWLWQQDLRNSIKPEEAKIPIQEQSNLAHLYNAPFIWAIQNKIADKIFNRTLEDWQSKDVDQRRAMVLKLMENVDIVSIENYLQLKGNINIPFTKNLFSSYIASKLSEDGVVRKGNRGAYQEIANIYGIKHQSFRKVSIDLHNDREMLEAIYDPRKDSKKDKKAWIAQRLENNAKYVNETRMLLPQVSMDVPGGRYGKYHRYYSPEEIEQIRQTKHDLDLKDFDKWRKSKGYFTKGEMYSLCLDHMTGLNDFHEIDLDGKPLRSIKYWELEHATENAKGEKGTFFYIPGDLVKVTRVPGHGPVSHTMARLHTRIETESKTNFIITPFEIQISAGSDFDGDKRFVEIMYKGKAQKIEKNGDRTPIKVVDPSTGARITAKQVILNVDDPDLDIAINSGRNAAMMLMADDFSRLQSKDNFEHPLDLTKLDRIVTSYEKNRIPNFTLSAYFDSYERNRLVFKTVGQLAALQSVYDTFKVLKSGIKTPAIRINGGILNVLDKGEDGKYKPLQINGGNSVLEINGFSKDEYHLVKDYLGIVLNLALDNPKDPKVDRLGITEHTANMFAYLLMGDTSLDKLSKEEQEKELYSKIETIAAYLNSPIIRTFVTRMREMGDVDDYENASKILYQKLHGQDMSKWLGYDPELRKQYGDGLQSQVNTLQQLYEISQESQAIYKFMKLPKDMPNNPADYISSIMEYGRILMNDFKYLDTSSFFDFKQSDIRINSKDFFDLGKSDNPLEYLLNPDKHLSFDNLHPYLRRIKYSLGMASELFKDSIDMSLQGRAMYAEFIRSWYNSNIRKDRSETNLGLKYMKEIQFEELSGMLNDFSLKMTGYGSRGGSNEYDLAINLGNQLDAYHKNPDKMQNTFLEMIRYYQKGDEENGTTDRVIALDKALQRTKIPKQVIHNAREDFAKMAPRDQFAFIKYLVMKYGPHTTTWNGSYMQLIPTENIVTIGKAYEKTMEMFNQPFTSNQVAKMIAYFTNNVRFRTQHINPWFEAKDEEMTFSPWSGKETPNSFDYTADRYFYDNVLNLQKKDPNGSAIGLLIDYIRRGKDINKYDDSRMNSEFGTFLRDAYNSSVALDSFKEFHRKQIQQGFNILRFQWAIENRELAKQQKATKNFYQFLADNILAKDEQGKPLISDGKHVFNDENPIANPKMSPLDEEVYVQKGKKNYLRLGKLSNGEYVQYRDSTGTEKQARIIAKRMGRKFGINYEFADLGDASSNYNKKRKTVILNLRSLDTDISIHEFLHPFYNAITAKYPYLKEQWQREITTLANEVPIFAKAVTTILKDYDPSTHSDEMFTYFLSAMAGHNFRNKTILNRLKDKIIDLGYMMTDALGIKTGVEDISKYKDASLSQILRMLDSRKRVAINSLNPKEFLDSGIQEGKPLTGIFKFTDKKRKEERIENRKKFTETPELDEYTKFINDPNRGGLVDFGPGIKQDEFTGKLYDTETKTEIKYLDHQWIEGTNPKVSTKASDEDKRLKYRMKSLAEQAGTEDTLATTRIIKGMARTGMIEEKDSDYLEKKFRNSSGYMNDLAFKEFFREFNHMASYINSAAKGIIQAIKGAANASIHTTDMLKDYLRYSKVSTLFQPEAFETLVKSIGDYMDKYIANFNVPAGMNPITYTQNGVNVFYKNSGLTDIPVWVYTDKNTGKTTLFKFKFFNEKVFNEDGSIVGKEIGSDGKVKITEGNRFNVPYRKASLFKDIEMASTLENELMVEAHMLGLMYEDTAKMPVDKVILIPIQITMDVKKLDQNITERIAKQISDAQLEKSDIEDSISDARLIDAEDLKYTLTPEGRKYAEKALKDNETTRDMSGYKEAMASIDDPDFNMHHALSGKGAINNLRQARRNMVEIIGMPIHKWTMDLFKQRIPFWSDNLLLSMIHNMKMKLTDIEKMSINDLLAVLASKDHQSSPQQNAQLHQFGQMEYDALNNNKRYSYQDYKATAEMLNKELELLRNHYGMLDAPAYDIINAFANDDIRLQRFQRLISDKDPIAVSHIQWFISNQLAVHQLYERLLQENAKYYTGPKEWTLLADRILRNDRKLWQDSSVWSFLMKLLPKAKVSTNTLPASLLMNEVSVVASNKYKDHIIFKKQLKEGRPSDLTRFMVGPFQTGKTSDPVNPYGTMYWMTTEAAEEKFRNKEFTAEDLKYVRMVNDYLNRFEIANPMGIANNAPQEITWNHIRTSAMILEFPHFLIRPVTMRRGDWLPTIKAKEINRALQPSSLDFVPIKARTRDPLTGEIQVDEMTFGQYKYEKGINWGKDVLADRKFEQNPLYKDLIANYREAKKNIIHPEKSSNDPSVNTQIGIPVQGRTKNVILKPHEGIDNGLLRKMHDSMIFDSLINHVDELMTRSYFEKVLPFAQVISDGYELHAGQDNNPDRIRKYIDSVIRHEMYRQDIDYMMASHPFLKTVFNNLMRYAAGIGIAWKGTTQIMNIGQGLAQDMINNPDVLLSGLWQIFSEPTREIFTGKNPFHGVNPFKLWKVMELMAIGTVKQNTFQDPVGNLTGWIDTASFLPLTMAERINQGPLVYGYMKSLRPGQNIFDAYTNMGEVKPGMEKLAMQPHELQMMRNFVEGIHGHYGRSKAPYSYELWGRLAGMFKAPWMTSQILNMKRKYYIDANGVESVGFLNGCMESIGAIAKYAWIANNPEKLAEEKDKINFNHLDEASAFQALIAANEDVTNPYVMDRIVDGFKMLPKPYQDSFRRSAMFLVINGAFLAALRSFWQMVNDSKYLELDSDGMPVEADNTPNWITHAIGWWRGKDLNYKYRKTARSLNGKDDNFMTGEQYEQLMWGMEGAKYMKQLVMSTFFADIQGAASVPSIVMTLNNTIKLLKATNMSGQTLWDNTMTEKEKKEALYYRASGGRKWFQPKDRSKLLDVIMKAFPASNIFTQGTYFHRLADPGIDYQERLDEKQENIEMKTEQDELNPQPEKTKKRKSSSGSRPRRMSREHRQHRAKRSE